jgi:hypothetical protein
MDLAPVSQNLSSQVLENLLNRENFKLPNLHAPIPVYTRKCGVLERSRQVEGNEMGTEFRHKFFEDREPMRAYERKYRSLVRNPL